MLARGLQTGMACVRQFKRACHFVKPRMSFADRPLPTHLLQQQQATWRIHDPWGPVLPQNVITDFTAHLGNGIFRGSYAVQANMLTVWNRTMGSRTVQIDGRDVLELARALLREVVLECDGKRVPQRRRVA
jgi:hypothetical protein